MKRKRKTKIYVKVVGLKIRLAGKKKIRKVILDIPETFFFGGRGEYVPSALYGGKFAFLGGGGGYMKYQSSSSTGWGQWQIQGRGTRGPGPAVTLFLYQTEA